MKRKPLAARNPCGRIVQRRGADAAVSPIEARRLLDASVAGLRSEVWSTMLGRLHVADKLTAAQFEAGKKWLEVATNCDLAMQTPRAPRSAKLERGAAGAPVDPDTAAGHAEAVAQEHMVAAYLDGKFALKQAGHAAMSAVEAVVERDLVPESFAQLQALQTGLQALSAWWSSSKRKRR